MYFLVAFVFGDFFRDPELFEWWDFVSGKRAVLLWVFCAAPSIRQRAGNFIGATGLGPCRMLCPAPSTLREQ